MNPSPSIFQRITQWSILGAVFVVPLVFTPWTFEAFEFAKQYFLVFFAFLGLVGWFGRMVLVERGILLRTPSIISIPFGLFFVVLLFSFIFSLDKYASLFGFYGRFSDGLLPWVSAGILAFLLVQEGKGMLRSTWKALLLSQALALLVSLFSLLGIWKKIEFLPPIAKQGFFNPVSGAPEGFAVFLAVLFPLVFASLVLRVSSAPFWKRLHWFILVSSFLMIAAIDGGPAWLVLIGGLILFSLWMAWQKEFSKENPIRSFGAPLGVIILSLVFVFSPLGLVATDRAPEPQLSHANSWRIAFDAATEGIGRFFLGTGPGTWAIDFSKHKPEEMNLGSLWRMRFDRAGSHYPEVLATTGALGMLSFLSLVGFFLAGSFLFVSFTKRREKREGGEEYGNIALLGVATLLLASFFYHQNLSLLLLFWVLLGMGAVSWGRSSEVRLSFKKRPGRAMVFRTVLILSAFLLVWGVYMGARFYLADASYLNAQNTPRSQLATRIGYLERAVQLNPNQAEYRIALAKLYLERALLEFKKPQEEQDALAASKDMQKALAFARGAVVDRKNIQGATEFSPNRVASWEVAGAVYREIQYAEGARDWGIASFQKALELEPANPVLRVELGKLYLAKDEIQRAKREFEYAKALRPAYVEAHLQLALAEEKEGNARGAISRLQELSRQYPTDAEILFQLGKVYYNAKEYEQATSTLRQAVSLSPNHSNVHYALASAYERQGRIQEAMAEFERVLELNPDNANVRQKLQELRGQE